MIGPNALATAAHNLYSIKDKAYVKSVNVAPARSGSSKPYGSENVSASSMTVSSSYLAGKSSEDWAIITLKNNLGSKTGGWGCIGNPITIRHHNWCMLTAIRVR